MNPQSSGNYRHFESTNVHGAFNAFPINVHRDKINK